MKKIFCLLGFFVSTLNCYSQANLVNNGSFESYTNCPTAFSQIDYATGWYKSTTNNPGTSHTEYVNSCNTGNWVGVPTNGWGTQNAYEGQGYICQTMKAPTLTTDYRENVYTQLSTPLQVGHNYEISFRVSLGDNSQYTSNNVCAKFSMSTSFAINNQSHVNSGLITDMQNWVLVSGSFVADSAYTHMCIGNFYDDANTLYNQTYPSGSSAYSVYYIDSVVVVDASKDNIEEIENQFAISVSPNPAADQLIVSGFPIGSRGTIEMISLDGKLVQMWSIAVTSGNSATITLPYECPKGIYLIRFIGEHNSTTEKLVVE